MEAACGTPAFVSKTRFRRPSRGAKLVLSRSIFENVGPPAKSTRQPIAGFDQPPGPMALADGVGCPECESH